MSDDARIARMLADPEQYKMERDARRVGIQMAVWKSVDERPELAYAYADIVGENTEDLVLMAAQCVAELERRLEADAS